MIIDFHIHIFPNEIAERAISTLQQRSGIEPHADGTAQTTLKKMNQWGVDKAVCLNIATKPTQQRKINQFMVETASDKLIPFGTVHPHSEAPLDEITYIKENGIKGIKLHPDYQNFYPSEKEYYDIYALMDKLNLPVLFHTGYDIGLGCPIHCTPLMIRKIAKTFPNLKIIAAHFGGAGMWYDAAELLCDLDNVYFDTAFPVCLDKKTAENLINKKGAEKILFASDCPWSSPKHVMEFIDSLDLSSEKKELIFYKNAESLLNL